MTNKCYNGVLYPCQCLELGYLIRYQAGEDPQASLFLNGELAPTCSEEPACTGATTTDSTTTDGTTTADVGTTLNIDHDCETDPCHKDAICIVDGAGYLCECQPSFNATGVDLNDSSSNETACQVFALVNLMQ